MSNIIFTNGNNINTAGGNLTCGAITTNNNNINAGTGTVTTTKILGNNGFAVRIGDTYVNPTADVNKNLSLIVASSTNTSSSAGRVGAIFEGSASDQLYQNIMTDIAGSSGTATYYSFAPVPVAGGSNLYIYFREGATSRRVVLAQTPFFTGQHGNYPLDKDLILNRIKYVGLLVSSADEGCLSLDRKTREHITGSDAIQITEALPIIKITDKDKDPAVWGVVTNVANEQVNTDGTMQTDDDTDWSNGRIGNDLVRINGLGEGAVWVTNINGNICNGDYICSSVIPGYGRKQDDDILHNYTAAKSTMSCNFDLNNNKLYQCKTIECNGNSYIAAFISVSYHCS